jgi:tetratricopeptide (TPR) repeat protein
LKWLIVAALLAAAPALAQSKRYPPVQPDKDLEDDNRSDLWDSALHPDRSPYKALVRDAQQLIDQNGDLKVAADKLDAAIKRQPKQADAYLARGRLNAKQKQWAECADDLGRAEDYARTDDDHIPTLIELGQCQARAGRYSAADRTLVRAATMGSQNGELWRTLGEVRIALGRLDEAIDALTAAADVGSDITARWLLAMAYDRARLPSDAKRAAEDAKRYDPYLNAIAPMQNRPPLIGTGDIEYVLGLAHRYAMDRPEYALVYFRRYLTAAPSSPWRKRGEEHVKELAKLKLPLRKSLALSGERTTPDGDKIQEVLAKHMPPLRACLTKAPAMVMQLSITKVGPRSPESRDRPISRTALAEVKATVGLDQGETPGNVIEDAKRCVETHANKLPLPTPKEKDSYYRLGFNVVSP